MGTVWRGRHGDLGYPVAIKILLPNLAMNDRVRHRFAQEAWVQAQLQHPAVVRISDFVVQQDLMAIVMELVEGPDLATVMATERPGPWQLDEVMRVMAPVVGAVAYAHARKVVHRDLKPGNVLLERRGAANWPGMPKVTDFGLARVMEDVAALTRAGSRMGTVPFMPPEQFSGRPIDTSADVFALGMMFRVLLLGRLPVDPDDMVAATRMYTGQDPLEALATAAPQLPAQLAEAVDAALRLDPSRRPPDASAFGRALGLSIGLGASEPPHDARPQPSNWGRTVSVASAPEQPPSGDQPPPQEAIGAPPAPTASPTAAVPPPASPAAAVPPPAAPVPRRRSPLKWMVGGGVAAVFGGLGFVGLVVVGVLAFGAHQVSKAEGLAAEAMQDLYTFKTDPVQNTQDQLLKSAVSAARAAVAVYPGSTERGVLALASVWSHKWHYTDAKWDAGAYAADDELTRAALEEPIAEAWLARAILTSSGCQLAPEGRERDRMCSDADGAYATSASMFAADERGWLRMEVTWTRAAFYNRLALKAWSKKSRTDAETYWHKTQALCDSGQEDIAAAPVNAIEFADECAEAAGGLQDFAQWLEWMRWIRLNALLGEAGLTRSSMARVWRTADPVCAELHVERHKEYVVWVPDLSRTDTKRYFCYYAGLLALGCPRLALEAASEGYPRAPEMPYEALAKAWGATGREAGAGTCLVDGTVNYP